MAFPISALFGGAVPAQSGRETQKDRERKGDLSKGAFQVSQLTCALLPSHTTSQMSGGVHQTLDLLGVYEITGTPANTL